MKKSAKIFIVVLLLFALLVPNLAYRWYWGRNHSVLYDVKTIAAVDCIDDGYYYFTISGNVRNWLDDSEVKEYQLHTACRGSVENNGIYCEAQPITVGRKATDFKIELKIYPEEIVEASHGTVSDRGDAEKLVKELWFEDVVPQEHTLYMQDFADVEVQWKN